MLVLFGGNKYGAGMGFATLRGANPDLTNDYRDWQKNYYKPNTFAAVFADESCEASKILAAMERAVSICDKEPAKFKNSGHGTFVKGDGALCCFYSDWRDPDSFVRAPAINAICRKAPPGGRIYIEIDACEYGDSTRAAEPQGLTGAQIIRVPRHMQPDLGTMLENEHVAFERAANPPAVVEISARDMPHVACIAGCLRGPGYTCSDVTLSTGEAYGEFSHALLKVKRAGMTGREITELVNKEFERRGVEQRAVCSGGLIDKPWMS